MIQIGFCDDDPSVLDELHELLGSYRTEHNADIAPTAFQSPFELLASIEKGARFDILLLDVLMPGENGIEAAREIRQYDSNVKIIFLTSSAEFAVQSYTVGAYFYQLKPIWPESFFRLMDSVIAACSRESTSGRREGLAGSGMSAVGSSSQTPSSTMKRWKPLMAEAARSSEAGESPTSASASRWRSTSGRVTSAGSTIFSAASQSR